MNNAQHITMCALFLCNGFADLAVSISYYDDCCDCDDLIIMNNGQHVTMCALFLCIGIADLAVSIANDDNDCNAKHDDDYDEQRPA